MEFAQSHQEPKHDCSCKTVQQQKSNESWVRSQENAFSSKDTYWCNVSLTSTVVGDSTWNRLFTKMRVTKEQQDDCRRLNDEYKECLLAGARAAPKPSAAAAAVADKE